MGGLDESDADREAMVKDNKQWVGAATNNITAEKKNRKHDGLSSKRQGRCRMKKKGNMESSGNSKEDKKRVQRARSNK